ncbi:Cupredoxin [Decorospora gaudefroyi]|uniref:Cupredoxin n=1 Tax=Decorospora gaudefroyi TaxID=184978 RepID=A0A6A5KNN9_9PLEO|nr:Cupredoxin [Decorospora gaudefroyi]
MKAYLSFGLAAILASQALAGDDEWLSPVYKGIFQTELPIPEVKAKTYTYRNETTGNEIDFYEVDVRPFYQQVYPGLKPARLVGYDGMSPGPTFKMTRGREAIVRFKNHGDKDLSVHLHGSFSRAPFDGWAEDTTKVGQYKDYYYPNKQSGRTMWYHDHAVHHTAENAYFGQAGFYILTDPAENGLGLPSGPYDVPLGLASKQYNRDGTLFDPKDETDSLYGDVIHVNGQPWPFMNVEPRKYRFRILDTSISRAFKITLEDDRSTKLPFHVIAADTGLMTKPVKTDNLEISMAERWEIVVDFSAYKGKNVTMKNARDVQADEDYNSTNKIMRFVVGSKVTTQDGNGELPSSLRTVQFPPRKNGIDKSFKFGRTNGQWMVNGVTFSDVKNRILAKPQRGAVEVWELENSSGGWSHPVHIHLVDFQILTRTGGKRGVLPYEKEAMKDVVLLGRNEKVTVIARYAPYDGVYMFHCHNLIHEDHDMMAAFNVTSLADWGYPETTRFIDPMEQKYRSKDINDHDDEQEHILEKCAEFEALEAYVDPEKMEESLIDYWANGPKPPTTLATSTRTSSSIIGFSHFFNPAGFDFVRECKQGYYFGAPDD